MEKDISVLLPKKICLSLIIGLLYTLQLTKSVLLYNYSMNPIPPDTRGFFQEYDFNTLDAAADKELVIERLLAFGNREEIRWVFRTYGKEYVQKWLAGTGSNRLPKRRFRLWCLLLDVSDTQRASEAAWPY
ncbi:MAG: hypothetical protein WCP19_12250 [Chloroflexota bacterium]